MSKVAATAFAVHMIATTHKDMLSYTKLGGVRHDVARLGTYLADMLITQCCCHCTKSNNAEVNIPTQSLRRARTSVHITRLTTLGDAQYLNLYVCGSIHPPKTQDHYKCTKCSYQNAQQGNNWPSSMSQKFLSIVTPPPPPKLERQLVRFQQ